ncbi:MAG: hypothetical protein KW802_04100 [Candidatus Doudnabacteria bacterium]|nr:hypothetical protein [Candidatus Doudnabacteria bacterium]
MKKRTQQAVMAYITSKSDALKSDEWVARNYATLREGFVVLSAVVVLKALLKTFPADRPAIKPWLRELQADVYQETEKILQGRATFIDTGSAEEGGQQAIKVGRYKEVLTAFRDGDPKPAIEFVSSERDQIAARASRIQRQGGRRPPFALLGMRMNSRLLGLLQASFGE